MCACMYVSVQSTALSHTHTHRLLGPSAAFSALWPASPLQPPWRTLVEALYTQLGPSRALVPTGNGPPGGAWVTATQAVYPDGPPLDGALAAALAAADVPLPTLPPGSIALLSAHAAGAQAVCLHPAWLRGHLQGGAGGGVTAAHAPALLEYVMSDVVDDDPESAMQVCAHKQ